MAQGLFSLGCLFKALQELLAGTQAGTYPTSRVFKLGRPRLWSSFLQHLLSSHNSTFATFPIFVFWLPRFCTYPVTILYLLSHRSSSVTSFYHLGHDIATVNANVLVMSSAASYTDSPRRIANAASRKSATRKHHEFLDQLFGSRVWLAGHRINDITYESLLLLRKIVSALQDAGKDIHAECSVNGRLHNTKYTRPALETLLINISVDVPAETMPNPSATAKSGPFTPRTTRATPSFVSSTSTSTTRNGRKRQRSSYLPSDHEDEEDQREDEDGGIQDLDSDCLRPGRQLDGNLVLHLMQSAAALHPLSFRVLDPDLLRGNQKLPEKLVEDLQASMVDGRRKGIDVYNSFPGAGDVRDLVEQLQSLKGQLGIEGDITHHHDLPHADVRDSGIIVVHNALRLMAGRVPDEHSNYAMWRRIFLVLMTTKKNEALVPIPSDETASALPLQPLGPKAFDIISLRRWEAEQDAYQKSVINIATSQMKMRRATIKQGIADLAGISALLNDLATCNAVNHPEQRGLVLRSEAISNHGYQMHELDQEMFQSESALSALRQCAHVSQQSIEWLLQWRIELAKLQDRRQQNTQNIVALIDLIEDEMDELRKRLRETNGWEQNDADDDGVDEEYDE
ncbi:hypothetical protein CSOJ01_14814 [Colletotrichum sojae]|uniref:Uncharacterized protein n=1 Tax=Colletotrichum sojae TaxID=2175907 RepID=A0A8H6IPK4_9PEZI|nr:hypothetical protein CSOJ01_14814 [Colletotrichum sojae]